MIFTEEESNKMYWTSDTHFSHSNILKYCKRPFSSIEEHDKELNKIIMRAVDEKKSDLRKSENTSKTK